MTNNKKLQTVTEWLNNPLTKRYVKYLKDKEEYNIQQAIAVVSEAVLSGEITRTPNEIAIFNQIKESRTTHYDLLKASELSEKLDLSDQEVEELLDFLDNLMQ